MDLSMANGALPPPPSSALTTEAASAAVVLGVVTPSVQRRAKFDPAIESGLLASPSLFKKAQPRPRLLPVEKRVWAYPGGAAAAAAAIAAGAPTLAGEPAANATTSLPSPPSRSSQVLALDDYLGFVSKTYYPDKEEGAATAEFSMVRRTTLGLLNSPIRVPTVIEKWAPIEIARFESALCLVGKSFAQVAKAIGTKTTSEVIEFYYLWKQSKNYQTWKMTYKQEDGFKTEY